MVDTHDNGTKIFKRWYRNVSDSSSDSEQVTKAGIEVIKNDPIFSKSLGKHVDEFLGEVALEIRHGANGVLYIARSNREYPKSISCKIGSIKSAIQYELSTYTDNRVNALAEDKGYLNGIASRIVDAMGKKIAELGIDFSHPSDIAKYQPERVNATNSFAQRIERDPSSHTR